MGRGFSEEASELMAASVRPESSGKNYNYLVRIYIDWCGNLTPPVDPFTAPVTTVANFLAWVFRERDLGQSAVASFRSAISKIHTGVEGISLGKTGAISNLIKGIGNVHPSRKARRPRYQDTWNVEPVLNALAAMHPPSSLSNLSLSVKTLALVALATISRSSTLSLLSRSFSLENNPNEGDTTHLFVKFLPGAKEKTNILRSGLFIPPLSEDVSLDPVSYLKEYRSRFGPVDDTEESASSSPLWVSSKKPHNPVKSVTLASWLRRAMVEGGVDISKFKAHSVRAAAPAHFTKIKSLSLKQILARGGWKISEGGSSRTFIKFYQRTTSP